MGRRTLLLITSMLVAALGTGLVWLYVLSADQRATAQSRLVGVLVASSDIPAATPRGQLAGKVRSVLVAQESKDQNGWVSSLTEIPGAVVTTAIPRGQMITARQFGATAEGAGTGVTLDVPITVPAGTRASDLAPPAHVAVLMVSKDGATTILRYAEVSSVSGNNVILRLTQRQAEAVKLAQTTNNLWILKVTRPVQQDTFPPGDLGKDLGVGTGTATS